MNLVLRKNSVALLRWTLGIVVLIQSFRFVLSSSAAHFLATAGLPGWIHPALGGGEIAAAILYLVPHTRSIGGYALLVIFALAVLLHVVHGQFEVEWLVVYAMAVVVTMTHGEEGRAEAGQ